MNPEEVKRILREEMDKRGWHNNDWRAGLAAIIGGESRFIPRFETGYSGTSNVRIRKIFASRVGGLSNTEIDEKKATDRSWFNFIYGAEFNDIHHLGNINPDDGFNFRGGGLNQLTGRSNYATYGPLVGVDLIAHPELINTPRIAAAVAVEYMKKRFKGGDFGAMKRAVGISIGEPNEEKNRLYTVYKRTGEWNYNPDLSLSDPDPDEGLKPNDIDPIVMEFLIHLRKLEGFLKSKNLYTGPVDNDPGPGVRLGLKSYLKSVGS